MKACASVPARVRPSTVSPATPNVSKPRFIRSSARPSPKPSIFLLSDLNQMSELTFRTPLQRRARDRSWKPGCSIWLTRRESQPLDSDPELTQVARQHSMDMFARGYFAHV